MTKNIQIKVGDSVRVKDGTKDPDFGIDLGGWQGQVTEIEDDIINIAWDSVTLSIFPPDEYISKCEVEGLGWETFRLAIEDVKAAKPRDSEAELKKMRKKIKLKHHWDHLGESGVKISKILKNIETDDYFASLDAWEKYLNESLSLPFDAEISEYQFEGPLREGDKIRVHSILMLDDSYGVIVKIRLGRKVYHFPLCDIDVLDKKSENHQIVEDYRDWFANRKY
jgi:hypothetical protein